MNMVLNLIKPAIEKLTAPGGQFELVDMKVGGHTMRAYKNAPETLVELINAARAHGDKEFLSYQGDRWSFDRFFAAVDALAGRLQAEAKLEPGDRIAIAMRNRPEWAVAFAAASLVGAIPAPINSFGTGAELRSAIETVTPRVLFCDPDRLKRLEPDLASLGCHIVVVDTATDKARGLLGFDEMAAAGGPERKPVALKPEDPALLLFTSGASTKPKAVLSSQRAVCQAIVNVDYIGAVSAMTSPKALAALMARALAPCTLTVVPLFHVSGLHAQLISSMRNGRRLVFMHRWDPAHALKTIQDEKITQFNAAPSMVQQLMGVPGFDPGSSAGTLGGVGFGGAGLSQRLVQSMQNLFPDSMSGIGFGLTETNGAVAAISGHLFESRPTSAGAVSPLAEVRIVGDDGKAQPVGERGEIWVRGVFVMDKYWGQPELTAQALHDGFFRTGDIGYVDEAGFLFVVDRLKDVINRSGEKIAAAEVESCLSQMPEIDEAAVIAVPDAVTGEAVVAVVTAKPGATLTAEQVQEHVAAHLASYKVPSRVLIREQRLPRNPAGKVLKNELRALCAA
ncbi:MAG: acyl--CoA ligase [Proteobacteria bacterium]|nr:acyl--CoA ligase [Pseudomonadota bacterium]HOL36349.1 class I adenylate-forming enzyme family protein [Rubrivivax sp.]